MNAQTASINLFESLGDANGTEAEFFSNVENIIKGMGFSHYLYLTDKGNFKTSATNLGEELSTNYCGSRVFLEHAINGGGAWFFSEVVEKCRDFPFKTDSIMEILVLQQKLKDHGHNDFYLLPLSSTAIGTSVFILFAKGIPADEYRDLVEAKQALIETTLSAITYFAYNFYKSNSSRISASRTSTREKQLKLLYYICCKDLQVKQAAGLVPMSLESANQTIAKFKNKLGGIKTLNGLVYHCLKSGLVME